MSEPTTPPATPPPAAPPATPPPAKWYESIKDEALRNDPFVATAPDLDTFAKNAINTKAMVGKKAYELPQQDWPKEKWDEWNKTIGVPEKPDGYTRIDQAALEKAGLPPEVVSTAAQKFHEMGLTDRQAKGLLEWYVGDAAKGREVQAAQAEKAKTDGIAALKSEFGDKFDAKMALVGVWLKQNAGGGSKFAEAIAAAGLDNDPEFIKAIVKSAEATLESNSRTGNTQNLGAESEPASALMQIAAMKANKEQMERFTRGDKAMVQQWNDLHQKAYGKKSA